MTFQLARSFFQHVDHRGEQSAIHAWPHANHATARQYHLDAEHVNGNAEHVFGLD
jgi:hypothetical protein